jgi:serralysin
MATVSDITSTPLSGLNHIDALLDSGPDWNYLANAGNTLRYTFSIASGNEDGKTGQAAFSVSQQAAVRTALSYISQLTGIQFQETAIGTDAQIHLANMNIAGANVTGLCSWHSSYSYSGTQLASYDADAFVYLDNVEWRSQNSNLAQGTGGYETLLHELGHALGLKHSFEGTDDNRAVLPSSQDNTSNTLMSYTDVGGPYSTYRQDDVAALKWLYGGDGLGGKLGINSTTGGRYIAGTSGADTLTGTAADDTLEGDGGNDMIYGGSGTDTAVFRGVRSDYTFINLANGDLQVNNTAGSTAQDGTDTLSSIEILRFADVSVARADVVSDTTAPAVPVLAVTKNAANYVTTGNTPVVTGSAEAGSTVKIYTSNNVQVGTAIVDKSGIFSAKLNTFSDGQNYQVYATATDAAGNTSALSGTVSFNVDAHAPAIPTAPLSYTEGSNLATFSGTGEAGSLLQVWHSVGPVEIAETRVGSDGKWTLTTSPLPNGSYQIVAVSSDAADNATSSGSTLNFSVNSSANFTGTAGNDKLFGTAGGNALNGLGGLDTAVYAGTHNDYTVNKEILGFGITDKVGNGGHDALVNIERVQFTGENDMLALDTNGIAGQVFRLYQAAFDRAPDVAGMGYWLGRMDAGASLDVLSHEFMTGQKEFDALYGVNPNDQEFLGHLYQNVLHRAPDQAGFDFWIDSMNKGITHEQVLKNFSESPENQAQVVGSMDHGILYTPSTAL